MGRAKRKRVDDDRTDDHRAAGGTPTVRKFLGFRRWECRRGCSSEKTTAAGHILIAFRASVMMPRDEGGKVCFSFVHGFHKEVPKCLKGVAPRVSTPLC